MSKLQLARIVADGTFTKALGLVLPGGLVLRTDDMLWLGKAQKEKIVTELREFIGLLENSGFEVENKHHLDEWDK